MNITLEETNRYNVEEATVIIIFMLLMVLFSLCGNILTIITYVKVKALHSATNYFILSLAAADFVIALFVVNIHTMYMIIDWPYHVLNYRVCLLWLALDYWIFQVSVFGVLLIAGDRYLCIRFPYSYREKRTDRIVIIVNVANWVLSFIIWVPLILHYGLAEGTEEEMRKKGMCDVGSSKVIPATVIGCLVSYLLPVFVMLILAVSSLHILFKMKKRFNSTLKTKTVQEKSTQKSSNSSAPVAIILINEGTNEGGKETQKGNNTPKELQMNNNSTPNKPAGKKPLEAKRSNSVGKKLSQYQWIALFNMLLGITFTVNVLPFGILAVIRSVCLYITGESCVSQKWWYFGYIMCYLNSLSNPLCYAFGNKNFKKAFKQLLCRKEEISPPSSRERPLTGHLSTSGVSLNNF